jgi:hypothetical protein
MRNILQAATTLWAVNSPSFYSALSMLYQLITDSEGGSFESQVKAAQMFYAE